MPLPPLATLALAWSAVVDARSPRPDGTRLGGVATYHTLGAALASLPRDTMRAAIYVRDGWYHEKLTVDRPNVTLVGASRDGTIISYDAAAGRPAPGGGTWGTSGSYTLRVIAPGFRAERLTIENAFPYLANARKPTDDPTRVDGAQGVALMLDGASDRAVFEDVRILGHQDTLYPNAGRSYFHRAEIAGGVDFIFGAGQAVFDDCDIVSRDRGSATNNGYVTAASTPLRAPHGFLFVRSRLRKETPTMAPNSVVLGRPWHPGGDVQAVASVVFVDCWMDDHIGAKGWDRMGMGTDSAGNRRWAEPAASRLYEFGSRGPGAVASATRRLLGADEVRRHTAARVLDGWTPQHVPLGTPPPRADTVPWSPDLGDGQYRNPVIFADYSDPDVLRVGDDYYMTASSFGHVPALPILHSRDLVNWTIVNHAIRRLPPDFDVPQHGNGVWAPSLRAHDGWFYIYYGDPDRGVYVVRTRDLRGTWEPPVLAKAAKGWIDPAPLWDDDGNAYLIHAFANSRAGVKSVLDVARLSADGMRVLDDGVRIFDGRANHPTIEGPKLYERDGWYYVFAPAGGVPTGWQTVLRSRHVLGPYEDRIVMAQGATPINGPHQGGWVTSPDGADWFVHFQDRGPYGRIVHLQPMTWRDGWPVIGRDPDGDGTGEPVSTHRKPSVRGPAPRAVPQTSDEFDGNALGRQWQWQANDSASWARVGGGVLHLAARARIGANLWSSGNLLLQKLPAPSFTATVRLTPHARADGETTGLTVFGLDYAYVGVRRRGARYEIVESRVRDADKGADEAASVVAATDATSLWLRVVVREVGRDGARCQFAYSVDGRTFVPAGAPFMAREGRWVGAKVGLFSVAPPVAAPLGSAAVAWFRVTR